MAKSASFELNVQLNGIEELKKKLAHPEEFLGEPLREYFQQGTDYLKQTAKSLSPRFTGILQARITNKIMAEPIPRWGAVRSRAPHASLAEFGTQPHFPPWDVAHARYPQWAANLIIWGQQHGFENTYILARAIARRGTRGSYYMRRTVENGAAYIEGLVADLAAAIERAWESLK